MDTNLIADVANAAQVVGGGTTSLTEIVAWVTALATLSTYLGRAFHALATNGGLRGVISAIWLGTNTPKQVTSPEVALPPAKTLGLLLALTGTLFFASGCSTIIGKPQPKPVASPSTQLFDVDTNGIVSIFGRQFEPNEVQEVVADITAGAVLIGTSYDTNSIAYLKLVDQALAIAMAQKQDPNELTAALSVISIKEVRDPKVIAGVQLSIGLYTKVFGQAAAAGIKDSWVYTAPILQGIRDGLAIWGL